VVAYAEADLGIVRPFVAFVWGSGDGDPTDKKLHGFSPAANQDVTQITGTSWFDHLDTSANFAGRTMRVRRGRRDAEWVDRRHGPPGGWRVVLYSRCCGVRV